MEETPNDSKPLSSTWLKLAKDAFSSSTTFIDENYRSKWEDSLRMFHSQHPKSSKYNSENYKYRSRIFRPKTRSVIRKHEATAALAFFSNLDVVSVSPQDGEDQNQVASAMINKELLNYRLTKTIPWFQMVLGAFQDTMKTGICVSMQYWKFKSADYEEERTGIDPETLKEIRVSVPVTEIYEDKPWVELFPCENLRFSPAAHWYDIVNTSPYIILQIPMYVYQVKNMESEIGGDGIRWFPVTDSEIRGAMSEEENTTVRARRSGSPNSQENSPQPLNQYDTVMVHLNFMEDPKGTGRMVYYTLKDTKILSEPVPLDKMFWHGEMPVKVGYCVLDSHNPMPEGLIDIGKQLQNEANEIANQRLDNVKLVLNKRWLVKRNSNIDTDSLLRNVPGGVTMVSNTQQDGGDIREVNWQDVTSSSYQEQDRVNVDYDELLGNFAASSVQSNRSMNETVGGMRIMSQGANSIVEYTIRTFVETWVEPVLRQILKLEQHYESDGTILAIAGAKAKLYQKFGMSSVTDKLLMEELSLTVNVGMGATDPQDRLQKFLMATNAWMQISQTLPPDANPAEIKSELFGLVGYRDSSRFFTGKDDVRIKQLTDAVQQGQQQIGDLSKQLQTELGFVQEKRSIDQKHAQIQVEEIRLKANGGQDPGTHMMEIDGKMRLQEQKQGSEYALKAAKQQFDNAIEEARLELDRSIAAVELGLQHQKIEKDHDIKKQQIRSPAQKTNDIQAKR